MDEERADRPAEHCRVPADLTTFGQIQFTHPRSTRQTRFADLMAARRIESWGRSCLAYPVVKSSNPSDFGPLVDTLGPQVRKPLPTVSG